MFSPLSEELDSELRAEEALTTLAETKLAYSVPCQTLQAIQAINVVPFQAAKKAALLDPKDEELKRKIAALPGGQTSPCRGAQRKRRATVIFRL